MAEHTKPVGVLVKTIQVLRALARSESPLGPTELAQLTGLDRSAVHRILITLARDRLVERSASNGVSVGGRFGVTWMLKRSVFCCLRPWSSTSCSSSLRDAVQVNEAM